MKNDVSNLELIHKNTAIKRTFIEDAFERILSFLIIYFKSLSVPFTIAQSLGNIGNRFIRKTNVTKWSETLNTEESCFKIWNL